LERNCTAAPTPTPTPTPTPSVNLVQFSASAYILNEGAGHVEIAMTRLGDTTSSASVDFATSDGAGLQNCNSFNGKASSRCDYISALGTVNFAVGETSKTISIRIVDDAYAEGTETFTIGLNNPSGASLGTQSIATVTINDNESVNGSNPIDQAGFFVDEHYADFLNRLADSGGRAFWTNEITSCGSNQSCIDLKRINVSAAYFLSIEFQQTGYLVERLYKASYGSSTGNSRLGGDHTLPVPMVRFNEFLPDNQRIGQGVVVGQAGWEGLLENNKEAFAADFVLRPRFTSAFPASMTAAQFVDTLNTNAGSPLSAAERNQLVSDLSANAKTRAQVLRAVAEDSDLNNAEFNRAFVLMQYFGYLRRNPNDPQDTDYTGYDFWLSKLNQFSGNFVSAEMVKAFISSTEYRNRFGP
jgi:Calx-beta domain